MSCVIRVVAGSSERGALVASAWPGGFDGKAHWPLSTLGFFAENTRIDLYYRSPTRDTRCVTEIRRPDTIRAQNRPHGTCTDEHAESTKRRPAHASPASPQPARGTVARAHARRSQWYPGGGAGTPRQAHTTLRKTQMFAAK
eukprot:3759182-Prymnesium_polylepis.1